ncbi:MAG: response regulator transcription factor [Actinomycetota bacterium]|nr:response regulator transcription factor [Actinomycetota bacterium]
MDSVDRLHVVGSAATLADAASELRRLSPDVAILDASAPDEIELASLAPEPGLKLVVVGVRERDAIAWMEAGVAGYAPREATLEDVAAAVSRVARGELVTSPEVAADLLRRLRELSSGVVDREAEGRLTRREAEVLDLMAEGLPNKSIAARLSIQEQTVKNHVHNILLKLGVSRRTEAIARTRAPTRGTGIATRR